MTEIVVSGYITWDNEFGRVPIPGEKQLLVHLLMMANACEKESCIQ